MSNKFAKDSLGTRMKEYEDVNRNYLTRRSCVIVRIDGKAFHTFTKPFKRPFDSTLIGAMRYGVEQVAKRMQGFKMAYTQSDEASFLLTDFDQLETEAWFDNNLTKITTISASCMTAYFNKYINKTEFAWLIKEPAMFDARAFVVPKEDVANYFVWRSKDWSRNSIQMYCRSMFSQKQMHGKGRDQLHEMLHSVGKNWTTDLKDEEKNGSFLVSQKSTVIDIPHGETSQALIDKTSLNWDAKILPTFETISTVVKSVLPTKETI